MCGCGRKTSIAVRTNPRYGWVKGQPLAYCHGHHPNTTGPRTPKLVHRLAYLLPQDEQQIEGRRTYTPHPASDPTTFSAQVTAIIAAIAKEFAFLPDELLSRTRGSELNGARNTLYLALHLSGLTVAAVGRTVGRDHSTAMNGIARARADDDLIATAERCACVPEDDTPQLHAPAFARSYATATHTLGPIAARTVHAYVFGWLLGEECPTYQQAYLGLAVLCADAPLRARITAALVADAKAGHAARIALHARMAKLPWAS